MPNRTCSVDGCTTPARTRGWCKIHYQRWYRTGDPLGIRPGKWDGYDRPVCSVDGCEQLAHARGMCSSHFCRNRRHGDPLAGRRNNATGSLSERFWSYTDKAGPTDCWLWTGPMFVTGYGQLGFEGSPRYAHRVSYEVNVGPIPDGLVIDHTCHNADPDCPGGVCVHHRCVNPAHLEPVTSEENVRRGFARKRSV